MAIFLTDYEFARDRMIEHQKFPELLDGPLGGRVLSDIAVQDTA